MLVIVSALNIVPTSAITTARTSAGTINGIKYTGTDATAFLSIPFAKPPVAELRFAPPQPYNETFPDHTLNATVPAPSCIQFGTALLEPPPKSEDCLYLDVYVPPNATSCSKLPVKVFIYGGGETAGGISDPLYDGCNLAANGAIFVSVNYRLGPLGFLALESAGIGGNFGIQDILLGLQWVQKNIAAFGGDPKKVLLFGQSAGAVNVHTVATLPEAPSLIDAAITESGGGRDAAISSSVNAVGAQYATALGCGTHNLSCLRSKSPFELNATFPSHGIGGLNFLPYVDGTIIPAQPSEVGVQVPTIFGFNSMDGALFIYFPFPNSTTATPADYTHFLSTNFGPLAPQILKTYPLSTYNSSAFTAMATLYTDYSFRCPAYRGLTLAASKGVPAWAYRFSVRPSCPWLSFVPGNALLGLGATHTAELPYVFGNTQNLPVPNGTCDLPAAEQDISRQLIAAWTAMAAEGDPNASGLRWPRYTPDDQLGLVIGNEGIAVGEIDPSLCEFWEGIYAAQLEEAEKGNGNLTNANGLLVPGPAGGGGGGGGAAAAG
ncbi:hypothetical protein ACLMJK_005534 [Lecanora helva]